MNLYGFVLNNATNLTDNNGQFINDSYFIKWLKVHFLSVTDPSHYSVKSGIITAWLDTALQTIADFLGPNESSISYKWPAPPIVFGPLASANFGAKVEGSCVACCDKKNGKTSYQFQGSISVEGNVGVGAGSDAGLGVDAIKIGQGMSECNSSIEKLRK